MFFFLCVCESGAGDFLESTPFAICMFCMSSGIMLSGTVVLFIQTDFHFHRHEDQRGAPRATRDFPGTPPPLACVFVPAARVSSSL